MNQSLALRVRPPFLVALIAVVVGLSVVAPVSASRQVAPVRAAVTPVEGVSNDGSFEIREFEVDFPAPSESTDSGPGAALVLDAPPAQVALVGSPEMVILESVVGAEQLVVRSRNGGVWGDWIELVVESDDAPDGIAGEEGSVSVPASVGPIWLGDDAEAIEVSGPGLRSLRVESLESVDAPITANASAAIVGSAIAGKPAIRPRSEWATGGWASQNSGCDGGPWYSDSVRAVVVHHTVNANDYAADQVDDLLRGIYRYHVNSRGWCDVAYNFFIDRFGVIWEGRSGGVDEPVIGGHTRGFNTWTAGVALLGDHSGAGVSPAATSSLQSVTAWKLGLYGVDPLGTTWLMNRSSGAGMKFAADQWVEVPTVLGHRDLGETSCPGGAAYPLTGAMRSALGPSGQQIGELPYQFPAWTGASSGASVVIVDAAGGVRPAMGTAAVSPAPSAGAGAVAIAGSGTNGTASAGYVLVADGTLRPYGGAPAVDGSPAGGAVVDLSAADAGGGWILNRNGDVVAFGGAPGRSATPRPSDPVAMALDGDGNGYVTDANGRLSSVGSAPTVSVGTAAPRVIDIAVRADGTSGWLVSSDFELYSFGGAPAAAVKPAKRAAARSILASATGLGGWVLDSEGRLLAFGDVPYAGPISTHVGHQIAVDAAVVGYKLDEDLASGDDGKLARALYRTFIDIELQGPLWDHWARQVDDYGVEVVATRLSQSDVWAGAVVNDIYSTALGRAPDAEGRAYWVETLRQGMRVQDLGTYFYGSNEYFTRAGSAGAYVDALYRELLGRSADETGRAFWVDQLERRGARPADVAAGFYASLESRRDRVDSLYQRVLSRGPDPAGREFWAEWLVNGDDIDLAADLASSEEYINRATR